MSNPRPEPTSATAAPRWRTPRENQLLWRRWGDEVVVYHTGSGDTHQLSPLAVLILEDLARQPRSTDELIAHLQIDADPATRADLAQQIRVLITRFDDLGFIDPL
ncbi:MAG: HPr-rel-A system PqqD family peptide chaperone [Phycisphaeraceae bacterium]